MSARGKRNGMSSFSDNVKDEHFKVENSTYTNTASQDEESLMRTKEEEVTESFDFQSRHSYKPNETSELKEIKNVDEKDVVDLVKDIKVLSDVISKEYSDLVFNLVDILKRNSLSILEVLEDCDDPEINREYYSLMFFEAPRELPYFKELPQRDILYPAYNFMYKLVWKTKEIRRNLTNKKTEMSIEETNQYPMAFYEFILRVVGELYSDLLYCKRTIYTYYIGNTQPEMSYKYTLEEANIIIDSHYLKSYESIVSSIPIINGFKNQTTVLIEKLIVLNNVNIIPYCKYKQSLEDKSQNNNIDERGYTVRPEKYSCSQFVSTLTEDDECFNNYVTYMDKFCESSEMGVENLTQKVIEHYSTSEIHHDFYHIDSEAKQNELVKFDGPQGANNSQNAASSEYYDPYFIPFVLVLLYLIKRWFNF